MIVQRIRGISTLLALAQAILMSLLFWVLFLIFDQLFQKGLHLFTGSYMVYWIITLAGLGLEVLTRDQGGVAPVYDSSLVRQFPLATRQVIFAMGGWLAYLVLNQDLSIYRPLLIVFPVLLYGLILWSNKVLPSRLAHILFRGYRQVSTLAVGTRASLNTLQNWLGLKEQFGLKVTGLLTSETEEEGGECFVPVLGNLEQFDQIVTPEITQVIVVTSIEPRRMRSLVRECQRRGIRIIIVNDFAEQIDHPIVSRTDDGVNLITLFEEPLENPFNRVMKRLLDITISLLVIVLILPWLCLLFWLLHRGQSPGSLFHRQPRAGLQNNPFNIYKFRTMHEESKDINRQAIEGDDRIFPAGRWLRRFSLDEFPQFLNVLYGHMSVVGPRPHLIEHNRQFADLLEKYHLRAFIKPGITGLAQVRGFRGEARTRDDISMRLQSDLIYVESWSMSLDLSIIARTLWQMVFPPRSAR